MSLMLGLINEWHHRDRDLLGRIIDMEMIISISNQHAPVLEYEIVLEINSFDHASESLEIRLRSLQ